MQILKSSFTFIYLMNLSTLSFFIKSSKKIMATPNIPLQQLSHNTGKSIARTFCTSNDSVKETKPAAKLLKLKRRRVVSNSIKTEEAAGVLSENIDLIESKKEIIVPKSTPQPISNKASDLSLLKASNLGEALAPSLIPEFKDLDISVNTKKAISDRFQYTTMTPVQSTAIPLALGGNDMVVKAKTGTGKTLAFLIPAIDVLIQERRRHENGLRSLQRTQGNTAKTPSKPIILVLSPTRELASQIANDAEILCTYHRLNVITLVGGTNVESDKKAIIKDGGVDILIGTPGRMVMHLKDTPGFAERCQHSKVLIFDEADRLLDMGFQKDITLIMNMIKKPSSVDMTRQTLLFSATFEKDVQKVANSYLRQGYEMIDTVGGDEVEQTHTHVSQHMIITSLEDQIATLAHIISYQMTLPTYKVIVFFPTARHTGYLADLFNMAGAKVLEIHSRLSQSARSRASEEFRTSTNAIMFSSDVTARGMDYPDVSLVIQVGNTERDQYIHRLGRTARAGKDGEGVILCFDEEAKVLKSTLRELPIISSTIENYIKKDNPSIQVNPALSTKIKNIVAGCTTNAELNDSAKKAWAAWIGYYNSYAKKMGWDISDLVDTSKTFAISLGLKALPGLPKRTLQKMGLTKSGISIEEEGRPGGGGGSGGGGRSSNNNSGGGGGGGSSSSSSSNRSHSATPSNRGGNSNTNSMKQGNNEGRSSSEQSRRTSSGGGGGGNPYPRSSHPNGPRSSTPSSSSSSNTGSSSRMNDSTRSSPHPPSSSFSTSSRKPYSSR